MYAFWKINWNLLKYFPVYSLLYFVRKDLHEKNTVKVPNPMNTTKNDSDDNKSSNTFSEV